MIHEEICTYEVCKLAKEKGFPQHIGNDAYIVENEYDDEYEVGCHYPIPFIPDYLPTIAAPTQSLLKRWLREEKGVVFGISPMQEMDCDCLGWCATIYKVDENGYGLSWKEELYYDTYELVLENALAYSLKKLV